MNTESLIVTLILLSVIVYVFYRFNKYNKKKYGDRAQRSTSKNNSSIVVENLKTWENAFDKNQKKHRAPFNTNVAGVTFKNPETGLNRQDIIADCRPGDRLLLIPEEDNKYDPYAIKVIRLDGHQIGYINRDLSEEIYREFDKEYRVNAEVVEVYENEAGVLACQISLQKYR